MTLPDRPTATALALLGSPQVPWIATTPALESSDSITLYP